MCTYTTYLQNVCPHPANICMPIVHYTPLRHFVFAVYYTLLCHICLHKNKKGNYGFGGGLNREDLLYTLCIHGRTYILYKM